MGDFGLFVSLLQFKKNFYNSSDDKLYDKTPFISRGILITWSIL